MTLLLRRGNKSLQSIICAAGVGTLDAEVFDLGFVLSTYACDGWRGGAVGSITLVQLGLLCHCEALLFILFSCWSFVRVWKHANGGVCVWCSARDSNQPAFILRPFCLVLWIQHDPDQDSALTADRMNVMVKVLISGLLAFSWYYNWTFKCVCLFVFCDFIPTLTCS